MDDILFTKTNDKFFPNDPVLEELSYYDNYYALKNTYILNEEQFTEIKKGPKLHICEECKYKYKYYKNTGATVLTDTDTGKVEDFGWRGCTNCNFSYDIQVNEHIINNDLTDEEANEYTIINDPVKWAEANFMCKFRFYQARLLQCSARWQIWRLGRRSGKSHAMAIKILYGALVRSIKTFESDPTRTNYRILVITANRAQVLAILENEVMSILSRNPYYSNCYSACRKQPPYGFTIKLPAYPDKRVLITGFCAGDGNESIRGQGADEIYLDEADFISDSVLLSKVSPIMTENPNTLVVMASTTSGARSKFWEYSVTPTSTWVSHHYRSLERPLDNFDYKTYQHIRNNTDKHSYSLEYECVWGESADSVIDAGDITRSIMNYGYPLDPSEIQQDEIVSMGIDWNGSSIGNHLVIVGYSPSQNCYRLIKKIIFKGKEGGETSFYSKNTRELIADLVVAYKISDIYCDRGAGITDIEELERYCKRNKRIQDIYKENYKILKKVQIHSIPMQGNIRWKVPDSNTEIDKIALNLLVNTLVLQFEQGRIMLPKEEDGKKTQEPGLVTQLRNLRRDQTSIASRDKYVDMYNHTLVAFYLAVSGHALGLKTRIEGNIQIIMASCIYNSNDQVSQYNSAFQSSPGELIKNLKENDLEFGKLRKSSPKNDIIIRPLRGVIGKRRLHFERLLNENNFGQY